MMQICMADDVPAGEIHKVDIEGVGALALARNDDDQIFLFPDTCPHAEESLSEEGWVEDGRIVCGVHFAEFEFGSGEVHNRPVGCPNLSFITCEIRDGAVFATVAEEA